MAWTPRARANSESGFSLIELLVVMLIIGILAAIALPVFLSQRAKSYDAQAKSNARNLVSRVELCFAPNEDFTQCTTEADIGGDLGVPYGSGDGEVAVDPSSTTKLSYKVVARAAKPDENGVTHTFTIERGADGRNIRTCTASNSDNSGGCKNGTW
jgi:type IV pilus assembly protein PilA